jgi:hypothetical protein
MHNREELLDFKSAASLAKKDGWSIGDFSDVSHVTLCLLHGDHGCGTTGLALGDGEAN